MKIWIVNQDADGPAAHGPTRHYDMCKALSEQGHDVTLVSGNFSHIRRDYIHQPNHKIHKQTLDGFEWIQLPALKYERNNWRRLASALYFGASLQRLKADKPDVIIGSSPNPIAAYAAYLLAKRLKTKFVYEIRDLWPETLIHLGNITPRHPGVRLFGWIEKQLAIKSDAIIAVLPGIHMYLERYQIDKDKIIYFPNFTTTSASSTPTAQTKNTDTFDIVYLGAHGLANSLKTLIEAANILQSKEQGIHITLYGDGTHKHVLQTLCENYQLKNLTFKDPVPKSQVPNALGQADAAIILWQNTPLYQWGTSANKIFDYMAAGKPIIEAIDSEYGLVKQAQCGLTVAPENPQALAEAMIALARTGEQDREVLGENGRRFSQAQHCLSKLTKGLSGKLSFV